MKRNYNDNALDLFRILATMQVFLGHVITQFHLPQFTNTVYFVRGVPILFALCGFLAAKSLDKYPAKSFFIRRAARIIPGFWTCIIINTVIILCVYSVTPSLLEGAIYLVTQFCGLNFYTGSWLRGYGVGAPNGVLWTIGVQVQFFLLAPVICKFLKKIKLRKSIYLILVLMILSVGLKKASAFLPVIVSKLIQVTVVPYLYFLVFGMAAWCFRDRIIPQLEKFRWVILPGYIIWKLAENHMQFPHVFDGVMYNTITTILICTVIFAFAFRIHWRMPVDLTYGFYLYHMIFINIAVHYGYRNLAWNAESILVMALIIALTILFAWLSQKFVENPVAKRIEKKEVF